ncbi:unnamed protein product [Rotaria magnacalcarata]|uniref:Uncharacterized protein n=1 Tax=Rotaria magnacalcarata TaxID=392030 RepID=A0A818YMU8_9BILA|nr:unnamed protein product [Rotaria magnacalcarata]
MSILTTSSASGSSSSATNKSTSPSINSRFGTSTASNNTVVLSYHSRRILQNFLLVWLDANIDESNEDYKHSLQQRNSIVVSVSLFTHAEECTRFLSDITVRTGTSIVRRVKVHLIILHAGRARGADFSSKTNIEEKILQPNKRGAYNYSNSIENDDADIRFNQKVTDKRSEQFQRKFNVNVERQCLPAIGRSSDSFSCSNNPSYIIYDAIDIDLSYQKRVDEKPMSLNMKVNIPQQNPISIKYDEIIRSKKSFNGILKYSFNANDSAAEKTYTCDVNQPYVDSYSMNCQRERTNLTIDIDPKTGNKKFIVDLNRFTGERFGYETAFNFSTRQIETTYYTLVTSRMMKHRFGTLSVITAKQKDQEVQCITTSTADFAGYKIRFLSANIKLNFKEKSICVPIDISRFDEDSKSNTISLSETYPQQRDSSQVLGKIGSHNGLFGLETVKKSYKLQIGDAPLTVYDVQHWKTYLENIQVELLMMQMEIVYN